MPDYSKGCIYMIKKQDDFNNDNVYIGSCCNFIRRKCGHKSTCYNPNHPHYNSKVYQYIRDNGGWNSWCMTKIIDYPCNNKSELNIMERKYIDEYKSKLNCNIPTRTSKEYCIDNKDKIAEKHKQYYYDNHDEILEQQKQYYYENKDKILENFKQYYYDNHDKLLENAKQYYYDNRDENLERQKQYRIDNHDKIAEKQKQYRIDNRDKLLEQKKEYYIDNKDKIKEYKKQKVKCDNCGCEIAKGVLPRHKKSQKCINFNSK